MAMADGCGVEAVFFLVEDFWVFFVGHGQQQRLMGANGSNTFEKDNHLPNLHFCVQHIIFQGVCRDHKSNVLLFF